MKIRLFLGVLLSFLYSNFLIAQDFPTGLIFDDKAYESQPREPLYSGIKQDELPLKVDLRPYCPEVGNQGRIKSCVGWAVGYGALTISRAIQNEWTDKTYITDQANSALFIYNQIKGEENCMRGSKIDEAVELVTTKGNCLAKHFDEDVNNCIKVPNRQALGEARNFIAQDYLTLFGKKDDNQVKVFKVKNALANDKPVIVGLKIRENFTKLDGEKYWRPEIGRKTFAGGHAMVVVGYNEAVSAFLLMNSWGESWGRGGFIWVKYKDFREFCQYAYVLHLGEKEAVEVDVKHIVQRRANSNSPTSTSRRFTGEDKPAPNPSGTSEGGEHTECPPSPIGPSPSSYRGSPIGSNQAYLKTYPRKRKPKKIREYQRPSVRRNVVAEQSFLAGQFSFNYLLPEEEDIVFKTAAVRYNGAYYSVRRKDWEINQFFQLEAISDTKDEYVYVFTVDAEGEVNFHWPRQQGLNEEFDGINESALILSPGAVITIPSEDSGLVLTKKGIDHLCILFSSVEIENFKEIGKYMSDKKETFFDSLTGLLRDYVVPSEEIEFTPNRVQFYTNSNKGYIVPIILELESK